MLFVETLEETREFGASLLSQKPAAAMDFHSKLKFGASQRFLPKEVRQCFSDSPCRTGPFFLASCFIYFFNLLQILTFVLYSVRQIY